MPPFGKVLIANRGEIAVRIARAVKEMGMRAVAIFSEADRGALHTKVADESYLVGPSPPAESYLNVNRILEVAERAKVDAVHPGYGFLSENAEFARAVERAGFTFIGPDWRVMEKFKDKVEAKRIAKRAGAPVVPGPLNVVNSLDEALKVAEEVGYPIMLKAAWGGGGIGTTLVSSVQQLVEAFERNRRLALNAFGRPDLYIEKAVLEPKHIEVQIIADRYGNAIYAYERECTIQRKNQKLIEEAPSPSIDQGTRREMGEAAVNIARDIGYFTVGTSEFVYSRGKFYFIEFNKRLQVEHPVTEMVTGIDLVKTQISLAAGEELKYSQGDLKIRGSAIEVRVNAEDPLNDFVGNAGTITYFRQPSGPGVRLDSGVEQGSQVPPFYDSLLAKLIAYGETRSEAIAVMRRALSELRIGGVKTNVGFHKWVMKDQDFLEGKFTTSYIANKLTQFKLELRRREIVKGALGLLMRRKTSKGLQAKSTYTVDGRIGSWRISVMHFQTG
jgi:acetyl-CoA/propionyl-CoA carboxylase